MKLHKMKKIKCCDINYCVKRNFVTKISLADVCPTGSSNNELRILTDFLQTIINTKRS